MKPLFTLFVMIVLFSACGNRGGVEHTVNDTTNYLRNIIAFTTDSLINVVIEIPAGTTQKWEVNKESGKIEWEQVTTDSFRVINYLSYPANYGFVPQTILHESSGGDGDPVDVFVLGSSIARGEIVKVKIVGIIHMLDNNESDSKLLAVSADEPGFEADSFEVLNNNYPGVIDILSLWLLNYKGEGQVNILSVNDERDAIRYLKAAHSDYINQLPSRSKTVDHKNRSTGNVRPKENQRLKSQRIEEE